jgi:uncharacterized protein (TIGR00369 family)
MEFVRRWIEAAPYHRALGLQLEALSEESARLRLSFREVNTNPGGVLHGGCAASLASVGAQTVARAALGEASGPWHTAELQVNYLAAARNQDVLARARLLRRGKALCFVEVDVETEDAKPIAHATTVVRARAGEAPAALPACAGDDGAADPGRMGPMLHLVPFIGARGIRTEHMMGGTSRLVLPWQDGNGDAGGGVHEGALLALLDTAGAMASWARTGHGNYKASTPSMQAQVLAPAPKEDLVAYGRNVQRDGELLWSDVEIAGAASGRVSARGTVLYRILTGEERA